MAPFICCGFRKPPSPQENPNRLLNAPENGFLSTTSANDFAYASHDKCEDQKHGQNHPHEAKKRTSLAALDSTFHSQQHHGLRPGHKKSNGRVHNPAAKVNKKLSRDSGFLKGSYRMNLEELARSRGQRRDMHSQFSNGSEDDWSDDLDEVSKCKAIKLASTNNSVRTDVLNRLPFAGCHADQDTQRNFASPRAS